MLGWIGSGFLLLALLGIPIGISFTIGSPAIFLAVFLVVLALCLGEGAYQIQLASTVEQPELAPPAANEVAIHSTVIQELVIYGDVNAPLIVKIIGPDDPSEPGERTEAVLGQAEAEGEEGNDVGDGGDYGDGPDSPD